jgi:hypothetical protein
MNGLEDKLKGGIVISLSFAERQVLLARDEWCVGDGQEMSMMRCLWCVKNMTQWLIWKAKYPVDCSYYMMMPE